MHSPGATADRWATVLKFGYYSFGKMFWTLFVMLARVVDPVTAQQVIGIITGMGM
jgi:hypothetical protein